jgi:toxin ParE1/3/4
VKKVEFKSAALVDTDAISDFYSLVDEDVEERWIKAVEKLVGEIARRPSFGSSTYAQQLAIEGLKHRHVPRFPYLIFYVEQADSIVIVRVLHERRDVAAELED